MSYNCLNAGEELCATECVSLSDCSECNCSVLSDSPGGPWGDFMDVVFCLFPIAFLVYTVISGSLPTTVSLPAAAIMLFFIRLAYLGSDVVLTCAAVVLGILETLTPLTIMAGAIGLFETMQATGCLPFILHEMEVLTGHNNVAELALIFSFAYLMEGASGFGTPVALCAPMLVRMGHEPQTSITVVLLFNTFATVWGAVGTPLWFGFGGVVAKDNTPDQAEDMLLAISFKSSVALATSAVFLLPLIYGLLVPMQDVKANGLFLALNIISTIGPNIALAYVNYEFPSLAGGLVGCVVSGILILFKVGLAEPKEHNNHCDDDEDNDDDPEANDENDSQNNNALKQDGEDNSPSGARDSPASSLFTSEANENASSTSPPSLLDAKAAQPKNGSDEDDNKNINSTDDQTLPFSDSEIKQRQREYLEQAKQSFHSQTQEPRPTGKAYIRQLVLHTFPLWAVVVLLVLTRVEQVGLKEKLTKQEPYFDIHFGTLGNFRLSSSLVFQFRDILTYPNLNWKYELLYIPFLMPFGIVAMLTMILFRKDLTCSPMDIVKTVAGRLYNPAIALLGALILVQLMIRTGEASPAFLLGSILSDWFKEGFVVASPLLGALGSFFSGSTTVSNLTFGEIQNIAAEIIGTSPTTMLALQAVGGSAGNGVCLNNIISACAVVGLTTAGIEGRILLSTYKYVLASTTIATAVMLALFFRF